MNFEHQKHSIYIDQSITIGDRNKINNSNIARKIENNSKEISAAKKKFSDKHPILLSIIIGLITGFVLLFSFWQDVVKWIEGLF